MRILIEGVDRSGKDTLRQYIKKLSNYKYVVDVRGPISCLVYDEMYHRTTKERCREFMSLINKDTLYVFLDAFDDDLNIRAALSNHPKENWELQRNLFDYWSDQLESQDFDVMRFNTSYMTMREVAIVILKEIDKLCK